MLSIQPIEPPPAPSDSTWIIGVPMRERKKLLSLVTWVWPWCVSVMSNEVPPMSTVMKFAKPSGCAICRPAIGAEAGPGVIPFTHPPPPQPGPRGHAAVGLEVAHRHPQAAVLKELVDARRIGAKHRAQVSVEHGGRSARVLAHLREHLDAHRDIGLGQQLAHD